MTCKRKAGIVDCSVPPSRVITAACCSGESPWTSLTIRVTVSVWLAANASVQKLPATIRATHKSAIDTIFFIKGSLIQLSFKTRFSRKSFLNNFAQAKKLKTIIFYYTSGHLSK